MTTPLRVALFDNGIPSWLRLRLDEKPYADGRVKCQADTFTVWDFDVVVDAIEGVGVFRHSKTVGGKRWPMHGAVVGITTDVVGAAAERIIGRQFGVKIS